MKMPTPTNELVEPVLAGNRRAIARLISRAEEGSSECLRILAKILEFLGVFQSHGWNINFTYLYFFFMLIILVKKFFPPINEIFVTREDNRWGARWVSH